MITSMTTAQINYTLTPHFIEQAGIDPNTTVVSWRSLTRDEALFHLAFYANITTDDLDRAQFGIGAYVLSNGMEVTYWQVNDEVRPYDITIFGQVDNTTMFSLAKSPVIMEVK